MTLVEKLYLENNSRLSGMERIERSAAIFAWTRSMIKREVESKLEVRSEEELKILVARRMYKEDKKVISLIESQLEDVFS